MKRTPRVLRDDVHYVKCVIFGLLLRIDIHYDALFINKGLARQFKLRVGFKGACSPDFILRVIVPRIQKTSSSTCVFLRSERQVSVSAGFQTLAYRRMKTDA